MPQFLAGVADDPKLWEVSPFTLVPESSRAELLARSRIAKVSAGECLLRQGRFPTDVIVLLEGRLKKVSGQADSDGGFLIEPYQAVGLDSLLQRAPLAYSLVADEGSTVRVIPWKELMACVGHIPGLVPYLAQVSESSVIRELDLSMSEMGCSQEFRCELLGAMRFETLAPETLLCRHDTQPEFAFYSVLGTIQAFAKTDQGGLAPLWVAPNFTWQLFEECLEHKLIAHDLKAASKVELYKVPRKTLELLKDKSPGDFEGFEKLVRHVEVEKQEDDPGEVERLEELFPPAPKRTRSLRLSYPWVAQNDEMDCGPACMAMVSKYFGNELPIQFWRARMSTNQEGTSLFDLAAASEKVGFVSHGLCLEDLRRVEPHLFPLIALRKYHYLVVYRAGRAGAVVGDPAIGVRTIPWAEFKEGFDGYVLMLKPTEQFYHEAAPQRGYRHYLDMFKGQGFEVALIVLTSLVLTVLQMAPAFLSQFVLDQVLGKKDLKLLLLAGVAAAVVTLMIAALTWLRGYYFAFVASRFDFVSLSAFMRKLFSLPYDFFATRHFGDFSRRLSELERVRQFATSQTVGTLLSFLNLIVYGVALFRYSPLVAAVVYVGAPLLLGLSFLFTHRLRLLYGETFAVRSDQEGLVADQIKGIATIKTLGAEVASRWRFEEALVKTLRSSYDFTLTATALNSLSYFVDQAVNWGVMGLAAAIAIQGRMTPGQVVAVSVLARGVIDPFNGLAGMWSDLQEVRTILDRLNDVFLAESESRPDKRALIKNKLRGEIEFRDVWFRYGGEASEWILKGMSFHILPGQNVAIVGASGAGKSTLALLTARLYEPTKGSILIDGRDYREYDRQWLRQQIGLLLQETALFHGSILENIAYSDPRPNMARVEAVAEAADAKGFISEKGSGYDYLITHGGLGLSGGQKQRIAIARILYANPTILFMDEATSSLDAHSERVVGKTLRESSKNRTLLTIAHRYATVKMSDFAMVVDDGKVVEFGTHAQLLSLGGFYARLFADQI